MNSQNTYSVCSHTVMKVDRWYGAITILTVNSFFSGLRKLFSRLVTFKCMESPQLTIVRFVNS